MEFGAHRAIKLLEHGMKVFERILKRRLRGKVNIYGMQFGFMPGKGTTNGIFVVRQMQEMFLAKKTIVLRICGPGEGPDRIPREVVR